MKCVKNAENLYDFQSVKSIVFEYSQLKNIRLQTHESAWASRLECCKGRISKFISHALWAIRIGKFNKLRKPTNL
jgi:hypothetical protein